MKPAELIESNVLGVERSEERDRSTWPQHPMLRHRNWSPTPTCLALARLLLRANSLVQERTGMESHMREYVHLDDGDALSRRISFGGR